MLDLKAIRQNPKPFITAMEQRNASAEAIQNIIQLDGQWRALKNQNEEFKAERNTLSSQINEGKKAGKNVEQIILRTRQISDEVKELDAKQKSLEEEMDSILLTLPNVPAEGVPVGKDEKSNVVVRKWGEPKKIGSDALPHYELGAMLGMMDFERGAKLAGSRFTVLYGQLAKLERAISYYMLQLAQENNYIEVLPPYIVNSAAMKGTGQLPKFAEDLYKLEGEDMWLIPTAEVPLTNLHSNEVMEEMFLPRRYCALTPCFRKEAGNYQKDIKGIIRQHQFDKVELVSLTTPENSFNELERMVKCASMVLEGLSLPYQVNLLCTGDTGFSSAKTYDIEVWLPSQKMYREISSCSNCTDFQARRANIKFRRGGKNEFVHTLNGSALAVGRTMVALLENYQQDGGVNIPKVLQDFMQTERIEFSK